MKKILKNLADSLISRDQMKSVKGGCFDGDPGACPGPSFPGYVACYCNGTYRGCLRQAYCQSSCH